MTSPLSTTSLSPKQLIAEARYEVIPMKNVEPQIPHLPAGCSVSVTCSPAKGQQATLDLTSRLLDLGHMAVPHFSARLCVNETDVRSLADYCKSHGVQEVFLVAGDPPEPAGKYDGVVAFLRDFLACGHGLQRIGVTAYPDGHALIPHDVLRSALLDKQSLLAEAGVPGFASTQMCFDVAKWKSWAAAERAAGFELPLHVGVPGVIDRVKLLTMGMRLGIGASMRYVKKNGGILGRLFASTSYEPDKLINPLSKVSSELGIEGLHLFTFNNVQFTAEWQRKMTA
ncbi:MAG TPA: methylenetetrahydrofolate reductase [Ilumatobacteraceae bacterium]|nr:methylenetetrahydrofolate reductase [Ilumatobacteraceae bacterium]